MQEMEQIVRNLIGAKEWEALSHFYHNYIRNLREGKTWDKWQSGWVLAGEDPAAAFGKNGIPSLSNTSIDKSTI